MKKEGSIRGMKNAMTRDIGDKDPYGDAMYRHRTYWDERGKDAPQDATSAAEKHASKLAKTQEALKHLGAGKPHGGGSANG